MEGDPVKVVYELETPVDFYPRPHMEGDSRNPKPICRWRWISIHALTWRATLAKESDSNDRQNFYPRPRVEGDAKRTCIGIPFFNFYPRPRVEGDFSSVASASSRVNFYPRPRVEGDKESV